MSAATRRKPGFEDRYLAFVDVLGFRDVVHQMAQRPELFSSVRDTLKTLDGQARRLRDHAQQIKAARARAKQKRVAWLGLNTRGVEMTAFSDCYVVSQTFPAWEVLAAVQALGSDLLARGILCRGAVVHGKAFHRDRVLFGPAVIEAYELEQSVAKYPRILVTEAVREAAWGYHSGLCKQRLFKRDTDGCWFVNLLAPTLSKWEPIANPAAAEISTRKYLTGVREWLTNRLANQGQPPDLRKLSKIGWLVHHFNVAAAAEGVPTIPIPLSEIELTPSLDQ
jgi:hypothetical protein